jgi:hypothetical protein
MVVRSYNSSCLGGADRTKIWDQFRQKFSQSVSQRTGGASWYISIIPATLEVEVGESQSKASPGQSDETLSFKKG